MKLNDRIYDLRTKKGLSQGELAALLDVSRQSVSKWETGLSVPDMERLLRMREIFGITLEELVSGDAYEARQESAALAQTVVIKEVLPLCKIIGALFFCVAFASFFIGGARLAALADAAVYAVCGMLCFLLKARVPLFCAWAVYIGAYGKLYFIKGLRISDVFGGTVYESPLRAAIAWMLALGFLLLVVCTAVCLRRLGRSMSGRVLGLLFAADGALLTILLWGGFAVRRVMSERISTLIGNGQMAFADYIEMLSIWKQRDAVSFLFTVLGMIVFAVLGVFLMLLLCRVLGKGDAREAV